MSNNNKTPLTILITSLVSRPVTRMCTLLCFSFVLVSCSSVGGVKSDKASNFNADLGIRYLQNGRLKLANEKLLKALDQNPNSPVANHYFAILQQRLGNTDKARQYFKKSVNLNPKDPEIRNNYGSFLCNNRQPQAAIQQFTSAINDPLYATPEFAYTNAGICLRKTGNDTKAEEYFRNALRKKSAFPSALLEMAGLYSDRKIYPRAQAFMSRYESVGKSTPKALELCTIINQNMNDIAKSESCKTTLLRIFPESAEAQRVN
ncbi:MAG: type IV pilus assembly protein PilF [Cocleimonas sp.]|jgi:type IV pilus assembly protein PilF